MKTKGNTPKYGLIYHSTFIGRASAKNKGRISRYLANKCAIASRIDSFIEEPTKAYGEQLRDQVRVCGSGSSTVQVDDSSSVLRHTSKMSRISFLAVFGDVSWQVEERLKFFDTGEAPRKNIDVMATVAAELRKVAQATEAAAAKKKKSISAATSPEGGAVAGSGDAVEVPTDSQEKKKKKKKKQVEEAAEQVVTPAVNEELELKKSKAVMSL